MMIADAAIRAPPRAARLRALAAALDRALGRALDGLCAVLVLAEIVILFSGVIARYVLHAPLVWSDELAGILFLWLGMFGAGLALRRAEHLRMLTIVRHLPPGLAPFAEPVATGIVLGFLALMLPPAIDYVSGNAIIMTATLGVSMTWRTLAMPVGIGAMILSLLLRLIAAPERPLLVLAIAIVPFAALIFLDPLLVPLGNLDLVLFFLIGVPLAVFAGIPIGFAFGFATFAYLALATEIPVSVLVARFDAGMSNFILLAIPLFVLLGMLVEMTGMAAAMVRFLDLLLGHVRGGLHYVLVVAMYLISGISGSKAADMAAIAPALFPEMEKRGENRAEMSALLAATGAQTETIPPSLVLITIGSVTGTSIAALFAGGMVPGAVVGAFLAAVVWARTRRAPKRAGVRARWGAIAASCAIALPALALPFVIRFAVIDGVATATEVSTIGIVYSVIVGLALYRQWAWSRIIPMLVQTAALSGAILWIVGAATGLAWAITQSGFSEQLASAIAAAPGGKFTFILLSILLFAVLGSVLEGLPAVVLFAPLMFPIAHELHVNEVHYAVIAILAMGLGLFTPPFGIGFYVSCAIGKCNSDDALRFMGPYLLALLAGLVLVAAVPWLTIGLL